MSYMLACISDRIKSSILLILCLSCISQKGNTQRNIIEKNLLSNRRPTFSSPNAASLEKYVEFPTANYTGVPSIGVSIFDLEIKGVKVPISLSYHSAGIKVDDVACDVGIGWALSYGGAVYIMANGLVDEQSGFPLADPVNYQKIKTGNLQSGYTGGVIDCNIAAQYSDPMGPNPYQLYSGGDIELLKGVMLETADAEPDMYSFNFGGRSGKFFQDENGVFKTIPASELRIEPILINNVAAGYKIADEGGNLYEFKAKEVAEDVTMDPSDMFNPVIKKSISYNLTKITNPYGETVDFYYSFYSNSTYPSQKSFSRARFPTAAMGSSCWQMNSSGSYYYSNYTTTTRNLIPSRIDSIVTSNGAVVHFIYTTSQRTDFPGTKALEKIEVWSALNGRSLIDRFTLSQNYSLSGRLTLTNVTKEGEPSSSFNYNTSATLPPYLSYAQDHFGYYNGQENNTTLLPLDEYNEFWEGANRSVNSVFTQAGILTKITHPTGGTTEFEYEPNEYYVSQNTNKFSKVIGAYRVSAPDQTTSISFTVPTNASKTRIIHTDTYDGTIFNNDYCIIHLTGPNGYSRDFLGNSILNTPELNLLPGVYTLSIENVGSTYFAEATIFWFEQTVIPPHNELGGGLRIKEIKKYDKAGNVALNRKFEYKLEGTENSSGISFMPPEYIGYKDQTSRKQGDINTGYSCLSSFCQFLVQNSSSFAPTSFSNGSSVLYKEVVSYLADKTQNGYSRLKYNVSKNGSNNIVSSFPFAPPIHYDWVNGSLLEQNDYEFIPSSNQYRLVKKIVNTYNYNDFDPAVNTTNLVKNYGVKIAAQTPPFICMSPCSGSGSLGTTFESISFGIQPYNFYSSWHRLDKTEEYLYDENGGLFYTVSNNYFDNPLSMQVTRVERKNSKNEIIVERNKYAKDFANYGFITHLIGKNALALPIETYTTKKAVNGAETVLAGQIMTLKPNSVLPENVYTMETVSPFSIGQFTPSVMNSNAVLSFDPRYKLQAIADSYNPIGNLNQTHKPTGETTSYLWDYINNKPVAEFANTALSDVAFTSFESDGKGSWAYIGSVEVPASYAITGRLVYNLTPSTPISRSGLTSGTEYKITYWTTNPSPFTINGTISGYPVLLRSAGTWKCYEHRVTGQTQVQINGTGIIDELRLYPLNSLVSTYTYDNLVGMTTKNDVNNNITYFEYDANGRLSLIRDVDRNILKKICYNFQGQVETCSTSSGGGCTNTSADWQNTTTPLRCQQGSCGATGYQEQEQKDMNPCSSTYNTTRWILAGFNTTACPQTGVTISYSNQVTSTYASGFTAYYTNNSTGITYPLPIPATGTGNLGCIPAGTYTLEISKPSNAWLILFYAGCRYAVSGTSATISKLTVSLSSCNSITLQDDAL